MKCLRKSTFRLVETMRVENGKILFAEYHNRRMNHVRKELWGCSQPKDITEECVRLMDADAQTGTLSGRERLRNLKGRYKLHVEYDDKGFYNLNLQPYHRHEIHSLRLVDGGDIDYHYKYADRSRLNELSLMKDGCDEVIIVKDGLLTDTSFTNIALYDGRQWLTPRRPLLAGTHRQRLLDEGVIHESDIMASDLQHFDRIRLINAMVDWGEWDLPIAECQNC